MTSDERAEEAFRIIRALKRMDASMIPVIKKAIDDAVDADRADRGKVYARCPACTRMTLLDADGRLVAHATRDRVRCNGEGFVPLRDDEIAKRTGP